MSLPTKPKIKMKTYSVEYNGNGKNADGSTIETFESEAKAVECAEEQARINRGSVDFSGGSFDVIEMEDGVGGTIKSIPVQ